MNKNSQFDHDEKDLWKKFKAHIKEKHIGSCIETDELALYIDGKAAEEETQIIEAHLSQCRSCLEVLIEISEILNQHLPSVNVELMEKVKGLVSEPVMPIGPELPALWNLDWLVDLVKGGLRLAPVGICLIIAATLGLKMGHQTTYSQHQVSKAIASSIGLDLENFDI